MAKRESPRSGRGAKPQAGRVRSGATAHSPSKGKTKTVQRKKTPARTPKKARGATASKTRRHEPETLRLRAFAPGFTADDLPRSLAFYTDVLGFVVSERWMEGDELRGVMLKAGTCELGLSQDDWAKGRDRKKGQGARIWCETVQDVDALAARVKAAGFSLAEEPRDQPWGARTFSVSDPDGFHLTFSRETGKPKARVR